MGLYAGVRGRQAAGTHLSRRGRPGSQAAGHTQSWPRRHARSAGQRGAGGAGRRGHQTLPIPHRFGQALPRLDRFWGHHCHTRCRGTHYRSGECRAFARRRGRGRPAAISRARRAAPARLLSDQTGGRDRVPGGPPGTGNSPCWRSPATGPSCRPTSPLRRPAAGSRIRRGANCRYRTHWRLCPPRSSPPRCGRAPTCGPSRATWAPPSGYRPTSAASSERQRAAWDWSGPRRSRRSPRPAASPLETRSRSLRSNSPRSRRGGCGSVSAPRSAPRDGSD